MVNRLTRLLPGVLAGRGMLSVQNPVRHDDEGLSTRQAEARTGVSHSEFARIRRANFSRFTIDRLMMILARLGQEVELSVSVHPRAVSAHGKTSHPAP